MDQEITAMSTVAEAIEGLDEAARKRVLSWASDKFSISVSTGLGKGKKPDSNDDDVADAPPETPEKPEFETFAELFAAAAPTAHAEKVLVAGYWRQAIQGEKELVSATLNKDLAHLGHKIVNISEKFDALIDQKPQLALQLRKSGAARQARKKYKLTHAGVEKVKLMCGSKDD